LPASISICGDAFFDDLIAHPEVVNSYKNTSMANVLRDGYVMTNGQKIYGAFEFGGIIWVNYRGSIGGNCVHRHTDKCHIFPIGVPGLFRTYYAPADYNETVNTMGRSVSTPSSTRCRTARASLDTQMNALQICTRPTALIHVGRSKTLARRDGVCPRRRAIRPPRSTCRCWPAAGDRGQVGVEGLSAGRRAVLRRWPLVAGKGAAAGHGRLRRLVVTTAPESRRSQGQGDRPGDAVQGAVG
jgi:hypothetical protein